MSAVPDAVLDQLFFAARTHNGWLAEPVSDETLERLHGLLKMGPTAANSQPVRLLFVKSAQAKERLRPALDTGNVEKTMAAPVTAVVAFDSAFHEKMPRLFPHVPGLGEKLAASPDGGEQMARFNSTLQAGYLILAARSLGLDCGPMAGFDREKVDAEFFADGRWKSTLLINLGFGDATKLRPRLPRVEFAEACRNV
jgi:3-hydroxypropanoate dehydrogenase